jgi:tetratricopeptide (TPR) repeat protein
MIITSAQRKAYVLEAATMHMAQRIVAYALAGGLGLGASGCIKQMILDGQIESTRKASAAIDTFSDYEVANSVAFAGLAQFEGMHFLAPDNENALFLLTKGWSGTAFAFIEDAMEQAEDDGGTDSPLYKYQQARARGAYDRAIHYGITLLEKKKDGFTAARKNDGTIKAWLGGFDDAETDTPNLFWTGYAWLAKTNVAKEDPAVVADLFIGVAMIERAAQLDEAYLYGSAHIALGAYHARTAMAELDDSKKHFEKALQLSGGRALMAKFQYAAKYHCMKGDKASYEKLMNEVLEAGDTLPEQRLQNTIAKRKAKRYLGKPRMSATCGF